MSRFKIKVADLIIETQSIYGDIEKYVSDYIVTDGEANMVIKITEEDIIYEARKVKEEYEHEKKRCPFFSEGQLEITAVYRKIAEQLPLFDGFVFHGSAVAKDDKAYLFTAVSGTGKTTHTNLWLKNIKGSYIVNGDKPIIRFLDGNAFVYGTPWSGKERKNKPVRVPLYSLCLLSRGDKNEIEKVEFSCLSTTLLMQTYRPKNASSLLKTADLLNLLKNAVKFYKLKCNMEDEAAIISYEGMKE